ncbi:MAG: iron-sulfur cluster assembly protein [Flavobacteriaceae bacterium]|jgi:FeS assembly SUF system protein|nr:iron-sulfur cluster assembly protein [Flavobacteriaceae bacterium]
MALTEEQINAMGEKIVECLKTVYDPEIPVDIYELGLVYDVQVSTDGEAEILMTLTTPNCPVAESLPVEVEERIKLIDGIDKVKVKITFEPPWDKDMMSEEARFSLGFL